MGKSTLYNYILSVLKKAKVPYKDCSGTIVGDCDEFPCAGGGGGGGASANLALGPATVSTRPITNSNGTGVVLPSATTLLAGLLSATDKVKLNGLLNYVHPNHSGDVSSVADGATTISANAVDNSKLSDMLGNTVKVRNLSSSGDPVDLGLLNNQILGRGSTGDIQPIILGANLSMAGATLNSAGIPDGNKVDITVSGSGTVFTVNNDVVTNSKMANMPATSIKGAVVSGDPQDLTPAQVKSLLGYTSSEVANIPSGNIASANVQLAINELDTEKQSKIQYQEDGVNSGSLGQINTVNFTGTPVTLTAAGQLLTVDISGGTGATNIAESTRTTTTVLITSDTGTDATLNPATNLLAGVMSASDKTKLDALGVSSNGVTGTGVSATPFKLGGNLSENTAINGGGVYDLLLNQMDSVIIEANDGSASKATLSLSTSLSSGSFIRQESIADATQAAEIRLDADNNLTRLVQELGISQSGLLVTSPLATEIIVNNGVDPVKTFGINSTDHFIKGLKPLLGPQVVYYNSATELISYDQAPPAIYEYNVPISSGNTNSFLRIVATAPSITAVYSGGELSVGAPPFGTRILSADWRFVPADIQSASDGVTTSWVRVTFNATSGNTGISDIRIPSVQKTAIPSSGALSLSNAGSIDLDNNPATSIVNVGGGSITLRISGLTAGPQGGHLKFTNI